MRVVPGRALVPEHFSSFAKKTPRKSPLCVSRSTQRYRQSPKSLAVQAQVPSRRLHTSSFKMAPSNRAAFIAEPTAHPMVVKESPYPGAGENEIVVKNHALALNPVDWVIQAMGPMIFTWLQYPFIPGFDIAGEVAEVGKGPGAARFKVGDRIVGESVPMEAGTPEGGAQEYVRVAANMASHIPTSLSYEKACVISMGVCTAAVGLFEPKHLGMQRPTVPAQKASGIPVVIWGGSTSVGCNAIQLAVAGGYDVITTCSPKNFELVKSLGATEAYDYKQADVVEKIVSALKSRSQPHAGALAIGSAAAEGQGASSATACMEIVSKAPGKQSVAGTMAPPEDKPKGVSMAMISGTEIRHTDLGDAIWRDYLPKALAEGKYQTAPQPEVVGHGVESVQKAMDTLKQGVSAKKIVVTF